MTDGTGYQLEVVRTFIAIELPPEVREALDLAQRALREAAARLGVRDELQQAARWVNSESTHLTLKFLGATPAEKLVEIETALARAGAGTGPFELKLVGLGAFPSPSTARVLWVGIAGDVEKLVALRDRVEQEVAPVGFPTEDRRFHPHLTLARLETGPVLGRATSSLLADQGAVREVRWRVAEVSLMKSELRRTGAVYSQLTVVTL